MGVVPHALSPVFSSLIASATGEGRGEMGSSMREKKKRTADEIQRMEVNIAFRNIGSEKLNIFEDMGFCKIRIKIIKVKNCFNLWRFVSFEIFTLFKVRYLNNLDF